MKKEPIFLYILKILIFIGILSYMAMLYWSSDLVEQDLRNLETGLQEVKQEIKELKNEVKKIQQAPKTQEQASVKQINRPHMDSSYPNLLNEDLFFSKTLPQMLGPDFQPWGTRHNATIGKPDDLHPFNNWAQVATWVDQCTVSLANLEFGKYETMAPEMAIKIEMRKQKDSEVPEFWIHLRDGVFWLPLSNSFFSENINLAPHFLKKHQVTAHDFKFYLDAIMNPFVESPGAASLRNYLGDIEDIEIIDDLTFIVRWKTEDVKLPDGKTEPRIKYIAKHTTGALRALPSFVFKYFSDGTRIVENDSDPNTYRTNSVWAQNFIKHWARSAIVSCGQWYFAEITDRQISFNRNPNYFNNYAVLVDGMDVAFKNSPDTIWQDFKEGKLDTYSIQPNQLSELERFLASPEYKKQSNKGLAIKQLEYFDRSYTYIGWNEARVYFQSKKVRQALTMAIDRTRIIKKNLNGMGVEIHGPFFIKSKETDPTIEPWPYDPLTAKRLLREEGWYDSDGDGIIDKNINGEIVPFSFVLTYYVKNPTVKAICENVCTGLKEIGIDCKLNGVDTADLSAVFDDKNFDALCLGWSLGTPPSEPKQLWHSAGAKEKGSSNMVGFANKQIDEIIYALQFEYDRDKRIELYHKFDRIMHDEQPYTFLYSPVITFLYREYVQNVFIPADRQDLIPGADVGEPQPNVFWLKKHV